MHKDNVFDRLVKDLSSEDRLKMIEKIEQNIHVNQDPIDINVENEVSSTVEEQYKVLNWLEKLVIFIKMLFLKQNKYELTKKYMLHAVARRIQYMNSQYFNVKNESVTPEFFTIVSDLAKLVGHIRKPLEECFNNDKMMFYLLLGKLEFPEVHNLLESGLDPWRISEENPTMDPQDVRKNLTEEMESVIIRITKNDRVRMMESTRVLYQMYQLSIFPFHLLLGQFPASTEGGVLPAGLSLVANYLNELGSILMSFNKPPSIKLLEAVFLTDMAKEEDREMPMEESLKNSMVKTELLIGRIREFNRNIYLPDLLKLVNEDPFFVPDDIGGGEDWFRYYNQYWQDLIAEKMKKYIRRRVIDAGKNELLRYWDRADVLSLNNYNSRNPKNRYAVSIAVLNTFFNEIVKKVLYYPLRIVLVDGEFYKKNNRSEFEEKFEAMMKIGDRIRWFEHYLEPDGEGGMKIRDAIHKSAGNESVGEELLKPIYARINQDALIILEESLQVFFSMGRLLNGIVLGNGGTYDTLANFSDLGGKSNAELRESVQNSADHIHKLSFSLQDILNQEKEDDL